MKVYELMNLLSSQPAGNEVEVGGYLTMKEIKNEEIFIEDFKEYRCVGSANDVDSNDETTTIYF